MPDDNSSDPADHQIIKQRRDVEPPSPPPAPDDPHSPAAQSISRHEVQSEIEGIEDRVKRAERWMIGLTGAIAFFGLCSVIVGVLQWRAMRGQLNEMQSTGVDTHSLTVATQQQLKGVQAATVTVVDFPNIESPATGNFGFNIAFRNGGHVVATDVHAILTAQRMALSPEESVGEPWKCTIPSFPLAPDKTKDEQCFLEGLNAETWQPIKDFKQTIAVNGTFSYENGFGDTIQQPICLRYIPTVTSKFGSEAFNRFEACDRVPALMQYLRSRLKE